MSWCPYGALGLARGASLDDVKRAFKAKALEIHPDRAQHLPPSEQASAAQQFRVVKEAYDTLIDARKRAAYEATASSPYPRRGTASSAGVNTDWSRRSGDAAAGVSRLSRWQWWQRWARQEARAFDRTLHGGLAVLTLGGLLLFGVGGDLLWSTRNAERSFEAAMEQRRRAAAAKAARAGGGGGGGAAVDGAGEHDGGAAAPTAKRRPGVWLDSMRGRRIADDGPAKEGAPPAD